MLSKLGKTLPPNHFVSYANVHYFPFAIVTHTQSKPKPPSNQVRFDSGEGNAEGDEDENDDDQDRVKERRGHREDQKPGKVEIPLAKKPVSSVVMIGQRRKTCLPPYVVHTFGHYANLYNSRTQSHLQIGIMLLRRVTGASFHHP